MWATTNDCSSIVVLVNKIAREKFVRVCVCAIPYAANWCWHFAFTAETHYVVFYADFREKKMKVISGKSCFCIRISYSIYWFDCTNPNRISDVVNAFASSHNPDAIHISNKIPIRIWNFHFNESNLSCWIRFCFFFF